MAQAQRQALQLQARVKHNAERAAYMPLTSGLPNLNYRGFDFTRIITEGKILPDELLKQFFHLLELNEHIDPTNKKASSFLIEKLAKNMSIGPHALHNKDGYVIIGNQAYGQNEALAKTRQDLEYFHQHGKHMPPLNYPTIPPENTDARRYREVYPDVTKQVNQKLQSIRQEIKRVSIKDALFLIKENFPNNKKWDMQVNHGLPGQVVLRDQKTGIPLPDIQHPDKIATKDQYAYFRGTIRKAGYISNFAYGYAIGILGAHKGLSDMGAYYGNFVSSGQIGDNPDDIRAMHDGYDAYWIDYPKERRSWYNH